ncbi:serine protease [Conexibacter arvalis]|uniref:Putative repeat protein (TIGR01451 family) n=1 Tax=Conexibacter arvalis TaxID=912552 RepID=A0A840IIR1_9ACTN|nr:serine protease [Conexibacter arvalis]MBB4663828.1 putative repeat protein (TIGR01451 family) [Conexibacter arvalis]
MGASAASASDGTLRLGPQQPIGKKPAIVGGTAIPVTQAPWQVYVRSDLDGGRTYACGGSIVDATHVVTAGHCVYDPTTATRVGTAALTVVAGISNVNAPESTRQERGVAAIRVHPGYRYTADNGGVAPDDVAVLALSAPLDLRGPAVRAIALVGSGAYPALGTVATITGFGRQAAGVAPDGGLYAVGTTIGDPLLCGGADNAVVDCVASQVGSACEGDSGGPLTIAGALAGVASFVTTTGPTGTCGVGSWNGYTNLAAPEIRAFVLGDDDPPIAPRGGSDVSAVGVFQAGGTMTCSPGTWSGAPTFAYTFLDTRNGEVLQSGPSAAYAFGDGDVGRTVACQPAATNAGGTGITRTAASPAIAARPSQPAPQPRPAPQPSRPAARRPALRLSVNASAKRARPGATVRHAITVANRGRAAATRVVVCSAPGRGLAFRKLPSAATRSRGRACWSLRTVGAGGRRTVRVTLRVARSARPAVARNAVSVRSANAGRRAVRAGVRVLAVQRGVPVRLR